ncbi:hypothetical protein ACFFNY_27470 [Paenibacillus hodogayensis]|uniref:DUF3817 domain-containing protein n=1 Tax=Paenibacillus hodogayensis TaxID=279208 RepID=A0ABV5W4L1_9BACL
MKFNAFVWAYLFSGCWLLLMIRYVPHNEVYLTFAPRPWTFIVVNGITHGPILLSLVAADWYSRKTKKR